MKNKTNILTLIIAAICLSACSKPDPVIGKWHLKQGPVEIDLVNDKDKTFTVAVNMNVPLVGTQTVIGLGTWKREGENYTQTITSTTEPSVLAKGNIANKVVKVNETTFVMEDNGTPLIYQKVDKEK